ncbi:MAG: GNAT family N-acetyltransferase [Lachnospiraceae bacterium]|nr:GNAT family N-acetyltransferase [Lachnospiraceae bacterium]
MKLKNDNTNTYIIKADKGDLSEILDLQYLAYQSEARLFNNKDIPPLKQTLVDVENEYQRGIILKALDENKTIIGSVRAFCDNGTVYIGKLMVHPSKQGQGIGTELLLEMEKLYPKQRYELFTSTRSEKNIALYKKLGYKIFREKQVTEELRFVYMEKV